MKILHYFLGFPPYRTGGLTKYSTDLMDSQVESGNTVLALWPGTIKLVSKKVVIHHGKNVNGIENFELINPLPVALDEGIADFKAFMRPCNNQVFIRFLRTVKPDVIHIHTLMGLYKEFLEAAKILNIRTVFTTHDYFGLCPKVTMFKYGQACVNDRDCRDCIACNQNTLSIKKIMLMQSPLYRYLKNSPVMKQLRKRHRSTFFTEKNRPEMELKKEDIERVALKYRELRSYYVGMLSKMDEIHFNSTVAENVYKRFFHPKSSKLISITHKSISDNRKGNKTESDIRRLTCLAPAKPFKGYNVLRTALDELWASGHHSFILNIFSPIESSAEYIKVQEKGFQYKELGQIMEETDVLLAPSIWYETFGFTVLEAISYAVPVIVSDHVGAKDVIGSGGIVVEAGSIEALKGAILSLTEKKLDELRDNIRNTVVIKTWDQFLEENYKLYKG